MTKSEFDITRFRKGMKVIVEDNDINGTFPVLGVDFNEALIKIKMNPETWITYEACTLTI